MTDCMTDVDNDGYGDVVAPPGGVGGTDCFDDNILLGPFDFDRDGYSGCDNDCDDQDATTFPGSAELDSVDACMTDADEDGFGDNNPAAGVLAGSDCDDSNALLQPLDADGDGYTGCAEIVMILTPL